MPSSGIKALFGTASIGNNAPWIDEAYLDKAFSVLKSHGVDTLDTARLYGESEKRLGEVKAGEKFTFDTKWPGGFIPGNGSREKIVEGAKDSIAKLGVKQVSEHDDMTFMMASTANKMEDLCLRTTTPGLLTADY